MVSTPMVIGRVIIIQWGEKSWFPAQLSLMPPHRMSGGSAGCHGIVWQEQKSRVPTGLAWHRGWRETIFFSVIQLQKCGYYLKVFRMSRFPLSWFFAYGKQVVLSLFWHFSFASFFDSKSRIYGVKRKLKLIKVSPLNPKILHPVCGIFSPPSYICFTHDVQSLHLYLAGRIVETMSVPSFFEGILLLGISLLFILGWTDAHLCALYLISGKSCF